LQNKKSWYIADRQPTSPGMLFLQLLNLSFFNWLLIRMIYKIVLISVVQPPG